MGASAEGLEVLNKQNEWVAITALPDQLVVNVGDMLQRLTNYYLMLGTIILNLLTNTRKLRKQEANSHTHCQVLQMCKLVLLIC
jgi:hypothetical protein